MTSSLVLTAVALLALGQAAVPGQGSEPQPRVAAAAEDYRVGPQDVLAITVFDEPDLSGRFRVDNDGGFTYPLLGRIEVGGQTVRRIAEMLQARLADGYLRIPQVSIEVDQYRSQSVFVLGEVRSPGRYPLTGEMTLLEVLAAAGSTTANAGSDVQIVHAREERDDAGPVLPDEGDDVEVVHVSLRDVQTGRLPPVQIRDGATIFVARAETFFVTGFVRSPGSFVWERNLTVLQAISLAGGLTERGSDRGIRVLRIVDGRRTEVSARLEDPVQPGDTIRIRQRFF